MNEREWQSAVVEFALLHGWLYYHTLDSRGSAAGFPDLVLVRAGRLLFVELKTTQGKLTPAQSLWLDRLRDVATTAGMPEVYLWRPADWPTVMETLKR
jgi:hypothetical protein